MPFACVDVYRGREKNDGVRRKFFRIAVCTDSAVSLYPHLGDSFVNVPVGSITAHALVQSALQQVPRLERGNGPRFVHLVQPLAGAGRRIPRLQSCLGARSGLSYKPKRCADVFLNFGIEFRVLSGRVMFLFNCFSREAALMIRLSSFRIYSKSLCRVW